MTKSKLKTRLLKDLPIKTTPITDDDYVINSNNGTTKLKVKDITKHVENRVDILEDNISEFSEQLDTKVNIDTSPRLDVKLMFGAKGDGVTDDTDAINNAVSSGKRLFFPAGTYLHKNYIDISTMYNTPDWEGEGSYVTTIKFNNPNIKACIYRRDVQGGNWKMKGITIDGVNKTIGTNRVGIYSDVRLDYPNTNIPSYNLHFIDVQACNLSGDGFYIVDWFQQKWEGCYARNCKGNGFVIGGDQSTSFIGSMSFNANIDGASWWFLGGCPFLQGLNCGNVGIGLKLGADSTHNRGINYCNPTIQGLNVEPINKDGYGIYCYNGSTFLNNGNIVLYTPNGITNSVTCGIYFEYLVSKFINNGSIIFTKYSAEFGEFIDKIDVKGFAPNGGIVDNAGIISSNIISSRTPISRVFSIKQNGDYIDLTSPIGTNGLNINGIVKVNIKKITSNYAIKRDTLSQNDYIVLVDATSGAINIQLDYASYLSKRKIIIKKIDDTNNRVTISPLGGNINNTPNISTTVPLSAFTIISDGAKWWTI